MLRPRRRSSLHRFGVSQAGKRLVAFGRQQESFDVAAETVALALSREELVEGPSKVFKWAGRRIDRMTVAHSRGQMGRQGPPR